VEQIQFPTQLAVIALFCLFDHRQMLLQLVLCRPGRAINSLQHFVAVITTPIGARQFHELEKFQLARVRYVRSSAQVLEVAFRVQGDILIGRNARDDLGLVMLSHALEMRYRFVARQHTARHWLVFGRQRCHAFLNRCEVVQSEGPLISKVVKKAVLDHRANGDLCVWKQFLDRVGKQVSRRVADDVQAL